MRLIRWRRAGVALAVTAWSTSGLMAQERDTTEIARLKAQIEAITREIEELKLGREVVARADTGAFGLGPAASKVYRAREGVSLGGYGEVLYEHFREVREDNQLSGRTDQLDALRLIAYLGYKFNDKFLFNSEIEFEHGSTGRGGEASVEFAYLDYRLSPHLGLRGGVLLVAMGLINELHEPPTFLGTTRPLTEQVIVPSTWRESGLGVFGDLGAVAYRVYVINGLDAVGGGSSAASGFGAGGIRGGRHNGSRALAEELAGVARLDYTGVLGLTVGGSAYLGNSGQNRTVTTVGGPIDLGARTLIWEGHLAYQRRGLDLRGLFATATVDQAAALNAARALSGAASVGERLIGWYGQAGYDLLRSTRTGHQLVPYVRYERVNTQDRVPSGFAANPANDRRIVSLGAAWRPIGNIAVKVDYQLQHNEARTGVDQLNANLSYLF
ncbi:MAG: hypothetical protein HYW06_07905 [Gemmatimonadetes bacterium]|nr:hypothetical protein [Gemmatimonadota bacterium]